MIFLLETQVGNHNAHFSDIRNSTPISEMQLERLILAVAPQHKRAGLRNTVVNSPEDLNYEILAQTMLNRMIHEGIAQVQVQSLKEARDWVRNTPPQTLSSTGSLPTGLRKLTSVLHVLHLTLVFLHSSN